MRYLVLFSLVYSILVEYHFTSSIGQVVSDSLGSGYYAVLGETLLVESSDPLPTDRGLYFSSSSILTLPPNALQPLTKIPFNDFYMHLFVYITSTGRLLTFSNSGTVKITLEVSTSTTVKAQQYVSSTTSASLSPVSGILNTWIDILFVYKFTSSGGCSEINMKIYIGTENNGVSSGTPLTSSSTYKVQIGKYSTNSGFSGFMSEFYVFKANQCNPSNSLYNSHTFPTDNPDPYTSSSGSSCDCSTYSCTGDPLTCIQCDSACNEYCTTSSSCLDVVAICMPYAIIEGICDTSVTYISNCKTQASSVVCLVCDSGYNLSDDSSTCCLEGYYMVSSQVCEVCFSSCSTCKGSTEFDCLTCVDTTKVVISDGSCACLLGVDPNTGLCIPCLDECLSCSTADTCIDCNDVNAEVDKTGRCQCKSNYYGSPADGIECQACDQSCLSCTGPQDNNCIECSDPNAFSSSGLCSCNSTYFKNADSGLCESCYDDCTKCLNGSSDGCLECQDPNAEVVSSPGTCSCKNEFVAMSLNPLLCCHETCASCMSSADGSCLTCKDGNSTLSGGLCECFDGFYWNRTFMQCEECQKNCSLCSGYLECDSCSQFCKRCENDFACLECTEGSFLGEDNECIQCDSSCSSCISSNPSGCLTCANEEIKVNGTSGKCSCENGEFISELDPLQCSTCLDGCKNCTEIECFECDVGYSLSNGNCNRNKLELVLRVLKNNTIMFYFSEPLLEALETNQFGCRIEGLAFAHSLYIETLDVYQVNIDYDLFPTQNVEVIITFHESIQGKSYSLLQELVYNCTITKPIPVPYKFSALLTGLSNAMKFSVIATSVSSMFISTNHGSIWVTLNTIQTLSYIPLFNVEIPEFLKYFLIGVRPIAILPNIWTLVGMFTCDTPEISTKFYDYGFTCKNFLFNCGEFFSIFAGGIIVLLLFSILTVIPWVKFNLLVHKMLRKFRYSFFLRFWIQSYTELMLATVISLNFVKNIQLSISSTNNIINSTAAFVVAIILLSSPIYLPLFYRMNIHEVEETNEVFLNRYSPLFEEFNLTSPYRMFLPIFFSSKILFWFILYYCKNQYIQVAISVLIQLLNIIIMIKLKIFKEKSTYIMYIFEEFIVLCELVLLSQFFYGFSQTVLNYVSIAMIGISGVGVVAGIISSVIDICGKINEYRKKRTEKTRVPGINIMQEQSEINCSLRKNYKKDKSSELNWIQVVPYNSNVPSAGNSICEDKPFVN